MARNDLRSRAELGKLWYDELRPRLIETYDPVKHRVAVIYDLYTSAAGDARYIGEKLADLAEVPNPGQVEFWNQRLPGPLAKAGLLDSITEQTKHLKIVGVEESLLGEYTRHAIGIAQLQLVTSSSPAEVLVSDRRLIEAVINSTRSSDHQALDLWHIPFPRCWWEFSKPVAIHGVPTSAVAFFADSENEVASAGLLHKSKDGTYRNYLHGVAGGVRTGECDLPYKLEDEEHYLSAIGRLWDFVTCRNIDYEVVNRKRSRIKRLEEGYTHIQGKNAVVRQVFTLELNRTIQLPAEPSERQGRGGSDWDSQVFVPGAFHRWVYCDRCGDVHRHDLIGQPCRDCGRQVGPRKNIRVEKYWHAPHYKGPKDAPVKESVREIKRNR